MKKLLLFIVLSGFFIPLNARQDSTRQKKVYTSREFTVAPEIDGWINEDAWEALPWGGDFQMHEPYDDRPASMETRFKVGYDKENIYLAIRAFDPSPDSIVRRLTRRDDIDGDHLAFQFDSYFDLQTAFTFVVSAAGAKLDSYASADGDEEDVTWDVIWWVKTQIDEKGWTAEVKIPFSQLRFDKNNSRSWGFQVARVVFRNNEISVWEPISKEAPGWIHLFGELHGLENMNPKKQAEVTPYLVAGREWFEKEPEDPFRSDGYENILNAGADAKIGLSNNFTLDLTINPDFGQVEADPSEVNLTAFETFFEEQRPFFIEGKNIFDFDLAIQGMGNLFYSRRVGRRPQYYPDLDEGEYARTREFTKILGAAKVTGKTKNGLSVGIMESLTARESAEIDLEGQRSKVTIEPMTNYFAGRIYKDFHKGNTRLGGMFTSTHRFNEEAHLDYLHGDALSGGIDFQQYFRDREYILSVSAYGSQVMGSEEALIRTQRSSVHYFQRPDADYLELDSTRTSLGGYGANIQAGKQGGRLKVMGFLNLKSPGLELNDLGFLSSTDDIFQIFWVGYRFNEPFGIFRNMNLNVNQWNVWDFGGNHQVFGGNFNGHAELKNLWRTGFYVSAESEARSNSVLRGGPSMLLPGGGRYSIFLSTSSTRKLVAKVDWMAYHGFKQSASRYALEFELKYKPISNLSLSLKPEYSLRKSDLQYITQESFDQEQRYIFGSIEQHTLSMSLRVDLVLTPELTIQFWGQPFIASGNYSAFKHVHDPLASSYRDRFHVYAQDEISYAPDDELYQVTEPGTGLSYSFDDPDFNVKEFLANLVFRWEYRPGSYVYLVWSQNRSGFDPFGQFQVGNDFADIWDVHPRDVLLLKLSYRIGN